MPDIFEKIADKIDKSIKTVGSKSKELIETAKLKGEIKDVETVIENKFRALGKKVYEMMNRGALNQEDLEMDCKEIASLYRKIT